ncbi:MAG: HAMP domain-containing sensor histidine kinase [Acidimicrobiia bacterium]
MTIRRRITVATAVAVGVTVVVVTLGSFVAARQQVLDPIDESLLARASIIERAPERDFPANLFRAGSRVGALLSPSRAGEFDAVYYQIILPSGSTINVGTDALQLPVPKPEEIGVGVAELRSVWVDDVHLRVAAVVRGTGAVAQVARPLTEADQTLRRFSGMLLVGGIAGIGLAVALGALVSRTAVRPIESLEESVGAISASRRLGDRLATDGDDEVASLARAFNRLLEQLEESKAQQVRLVRDAGHELRTPLTALRTNLEVLQRHEVGEEERVAMIAAANAEVEELSSLVVEIVDLATEGREQGPVARVALGDVVGSTIERFRRRTDRPIDLTSDDSTVMGRRDALERAVVNLLANADTWSPEDGTIAVVVEGGTVTVLDEGPGFDAGDLPHVFERFYRSDRARTNPGSGLGLSIVEQVAIDHGGSVFAANRRDRRGAEVGLCIPLAPG